MRSSIIVAQAMSRGVSAGVLGVGDKFIRLRVWVRLGFSRALTVDFCVD
jgi:hypothetical protein